MEHPNFNVRKLFFGKGKFNYFNDFLACDQKKIELGILNNRIRFKQINLL